MAATFEMDYSARVFARSERLGLIAVNGSGSSIFRDPDAYSTQFAGSHIDRLYAGWKGPKKYIPGPDAAADYVHDGWTKINYAEAFAANALVWKWVMSELAARLERRASPSEGAGTFGCTAPEA